MNLRWRIALVFTLAVITTTAVATAFGIAQANAEIRKSLVGRQEELTDTTSQSIAELLTSAHKNLKSAALLLQATDLSPSVNVDRIGTVLDAVVLPGQPLRPAFLLDSDGTVLLARPPTATASGPSFATLPGFMAAKSRMTATASLDAASGGPHWVVPIPSTAASARPFFLLGIVGPSRVESILFGLPPGTDAAVLDGNAGVIAYTNPGLQPDSFVSWPLTEAAQSETLHSLEAPSPTGTGDVIVTSNRLGDYGGALVLFTSTSQLKALQEPLVRSSLTVSVGLVAFSILLGAVVARSITQPLTGVRRAVHRVAGGDLTARVVPRGGPELQELAHDFNRMARALTQSKRLEDERRSIEIGSKMKSEFIANMSHEFRTPLNAIIGFAELMRDGRAGPVSGSHKEYLGDILDSSQHLLRLINDVLDISRIEAGRIEFRPEPVDLAAVVDEVRHGLEAWARKKKIRLFTLVDPDVGTVETDPARLKQVLYNYMSNAIKFTQNGGWNLVRLVRHGDTAFRVEVIDNGVGIPAKSQTKLFQEFRQLDSGIGKRYPGSGLGLAVTKRLVESQGGLVGVLSRHNFGSLFYAVLPRTPGAPVPKDASPGPSWSRVITEFTRPRARGGGAPRREGPRPKGPRRDSPGEDA